MKTLERFKKLKILVGIPSTGMWYADFGSCLANMLVACATHRFGQYKDQTVSTMLCKGSMIAKQRMEIVKYALEIEADYVFFVDTDHTFPKSTLHRLVEWGVPVVAANCVTKTVPANTTARYSPTEDFPGGAPVFTDGKHGLERVWRVGTGLMLVDMKVFKKIGPNVFDMFYNKQQDTYQGEDWSMVVAMEQAGYEIMVDHDLSREVGHIGQYVYTHDVVGEMVSPTELERRKAALHVRKLENA